MASHKMVNEHILLGVFSNVSAHGWYHILLSDLCERCHSNRGCQVVQSPITDQPGHKGAWRMRSSTSLDDK